MNKASLEDIVVAVLMERSVGSFVGYRDMTKRLRMKHKLIVRRDTIMRAMRVIDPNGVEARKQRRLKRISIIPQGQTSCGTLMDGIN